MKPAFDKVLHLDDDRRTVFAAGPYDVQRGDSDAYFWMRISQRRADGTDVEVIDTLEHEKEQIDEALRVAADALSAAVSAAVGDSLPAGTAVTARVLSRAASAANAAAERAMRVSGPRWEKKLKKAPVGHEFEAGTAKAEGWLLTKTSRTDPGRDVFWRSNVTLAAKDQL